MPWAGDTVEYVYDFGDNWQHTIRLEAIEPAEYRKRYPRCLDGARACPPEDCGSIPGYETMIQALNDPNHPDHATYSEWRPQGYDPEHFSTKWVIFDDPKRRWALTFGSDPTS